MNNKQRSFNWFYIFTILRQGETGTKKKNWCTVLFSRNLPLTRTPLSVSVKPYTLRHFNNYFLSVTASSGTLRILALFTSGYNSVGTGVWEYRLRIRCRGILPPPRAWRGGGGGVLLLVMLRQSGPKFGMRHKVCGEKSASGMTDMDLYNLFMHN